MADVEVAENDGAGSYSLVREQVNRDVVWLVSKLEETGHEAYVVGGAVRDLVLGLTPKDYDVATSASPEEVCQAFGRRRARIIGRRFRIVHVRVRSRVYEVSTFRREPTAEERRGREDDDGVMLWRDNVFGTLEEDAFRRDFTINALYLDVTGDQGVIDYVGGLEDIRSGWVRMIGDENVRIPEDPVRNLRALKLAGTYGFEVDSALKAAIPKYSELIQASSRYRLFEELLKILMIPHSYAIFQLFSDYGFLDHFLPKVSALWSSQTGQILQKLLRGRDRRLANGGYTEAKTLALATLCFPYVASLLQEYEDLEDLWSLHDGLERTCREAVVEVLYPLTVPRFLSARVRDVILLMPRFKIGRQPRRLQRHPEYKYARELFLLLVEVFGWDKELADRWPSPPKSNSKRKRGRR